VGALAALAICSINGRRRRGKNSRRESNKPDLAPFGCGVSFKERKQGVVMAKHSHRFVETFDGFVGYGLERQSDEDTVQLYLQKFSDDLLMETILKRMTDDDLAEVFELTSKMLKNYLSEPEYHKLFLKE
jgi:hypothetical protein